MNIVVPNEIKANIHGFTWLAKLSSILYEIQNEDIIIDFSNTIFFEANLCAPLGGIIEKYESTNNKINITNMNTKIREILNKNGFNERYGCGEIIEDQNQTTISYKKFQLHELHPFTQYVIGNFHGNENLRLNAMPTMDPDVWRMFIQSITEIFNNANTHSESILGVFCCGQFFPQLHKLKFTLCDLGIGIKCRIEESLNIKMVASKAIEWAVDKRNTTKKNKPGGLGLKELKSFLINNKGSLDIVSDAGFWFLAADIGESRELEYVFHGTIVNIEINTNDDNVYEMHDDGNQINRFLNYKKE